MAHGGKFFLQLFMIPLLSPVLFAYRGATEAGRMGMSLTIATALGTVAFAWINTKASPFGAMIARRDFVTLDKIFFKTIKQSASTLAGRRFRYHTRTLCDKAKVAAAWPKACCLCLSL